LRRSGGGNSFGAVGCGYNKIVHLSQILNVQFDGCVEPFPGVFDASSGVERRE
jgi:hypothetical protein